MVKPVFTIGLSPASKQIREEVFCREQGYQNEFDEDDKTAVCLVLYLDETPIATGRLLKIDPATYQIGRIAVLKPYRGKKVGSYLVEFLCEKAKQLGANKIIAHSQLDKQEFYRKLGFYEIGDGAIDYDEGVPHLYLARDLSSKWRRRRK